MTATLTTCPSDQPDIGPFKAVGWKKLHPGAFSFGRAPAQEFTSAGGNPTVAREFDPVFGTTEACRTIAENIEPNAALYGRQVSDGFALMGRTTVKAQISSTGQNGQIVARLWDVSPEGTQLLVDRGVYALTNAQSGRIEFQLHGNGYRFARGHRVWLQLLGRDAPYYQVGNTPFTVRVSNLRATLPTLKPNPR